MLIIRGALGRVRSIPGWRWQCSNQSVYGRACRDKPDSNVVTGTFLLNNRYASILFDTGADRSFVSTVFSSQIDITPTALDHYYDVELADGKIIGLNTILRGCTLNIMNHPFNIDLMPVELGSFDVTPRKNVELLFRYVKRTARISIPPIEPNLAERARISAINLDDYQLDPVTPPPSPSSPFTMAAYQRMIAETDPTQREEALTETGQNSVPVPETSRDYCTTLL
ncbi:reverse transcriptase domain-containing protein [Tanacetum coccineum]